MLTASWLPLVFVCIVLHQVERVVSDSGIVPQTKAVDSASPAPTSTTVDVDGWNPQELYPYLSSGSVPFLSGQTGLRRKNLARSPGRLDIRQSGTCEAGYVYSCPSSGSSLIEHGVQILITT
ncbi:hypothetical protein FRC15_011358 [Serendipita sp. 397]|nr:hypothetical protein FRC15_011358 [Serendipita sp. 397]